MGRMEAACRLAVIPKALQDLAVEAPGLDPVK